MGRNVDVNLIQLCFCIESLYLFRFCMSNDRIGGSILELGAFLNLIKLSIFI